MSTPPHISLHLLIMSTHPPTCPIAPIHASDHPTTVIVSLAHIQVRWCSVQGPSSSLGVLRTCFGCLFSSIATESCLASCLVWAHAIRESRDPPPSTPLPPIPPFSLTYPLLLTSPHPINLSTSNHSSSCPSVSAHYICSSVHSLNHFHPPLQSPNCFHSPIHSCSLLGIHSTFLPPLRVHALSLLTPSLACLLSPTPLLICPILLAPHFPFTHVAPPLLSFKTFLYITRRPTLTCWSHPSDPHRVYTVDLASSLAFFNHSCTLGTSSEPAVFNILSHTPFTIRTIVPRRKI